MDLVALQQLAVSLGIGLLLGLERERREASIAGIRTFPLISLFGTLCAQLGQFLGGWIVAAGLIALAALIVFANFTKFKNGDTDPGMTTEIAALALFGVGALLVVESLMVGVVVGAAIAVLLHLKAPLHRFAARVGERDMRAIILFAVLSLIVLPVLPNADYGPYGVWNPFKIWLMVVFIVGISLGGYVSYKLFGARVGTILGGIIGGVISSTATTVSFARRSASQPALAPLGALVVMIAACISLVRVLVEIGVVAPVAILQMGLPLGVLLAGSAVITALIYPRGDAVRHRMPAQTNPAELKPALIFGGLYALVLWAVAAAQDHFGSAGLYVVGIISGLTDMDAITLSTSQMVASGGLEADTAWRVILVAALANFIFKFGIVAALGSRQLMIRVALAFAAVLVWGGGILWLWPAESADQ